MPITKKRRNAMTSNKTLKQMIPKEYKNSIYYDTTNFDDINKNILKSNLLNDINNKVSEPIIDIKSLNLNKDKTTKQTNKLNQQPQQQQTKKLNSNILFISTEKTNINGKLQFKSKILVDNSKSPYIKEYININGKKTLKKLKK